jgi:hypothetical protein
MSPAYDWRTLTETVADTKPVVRPTPTEMQREILRLYRQGLQPRDLATLFGLDDAAVNQLLFGPDGEGTV